MNSQSIKRVFIYQFVGLILLVLIVNNIFAYQWQGANLQGQIRKYSIENKVKPVVATVSISKQGFSYVPKGKDLDQFVVVANFLKQECYISHVQSKKYTVVKLKKKSGVCVLSGSEEESDGLVKTKPCIGYVKSKILRSAMHDNYAIKVWACETENVKYIEQWYSEKLGLVLKEVLTDGIVTDVYHLKTGVSFKTKFLPPTGFSKVASLDFMQLMMEQMALQAERRVAELKKEIKQDKSLIKAKSEAKSIVDTAKVKTQKAAEANNLYANKPWVGKKYVTDFSPAAMDKMSYELEKKKVSEMDAKTRAVFEVMIKTLMMQSWTFYKDGTFKASILNKSFLGTYVIKGNDVSLSPNASYQAVNKTGRPQKIVLVFSENFKVLKYKGKKDVRRFIVK